MVTEADKCCPMMPPRLAVATLDLLTILTASSVAASS